jgi:hypothetical protein
MAMGDSHGPAVDLEQLPVEKFEDKEFSSKDDARCVICIEEYKKGDKLRILPCGHHFHKKCADEWLIEKPTCPICCQYVNNALDYKILARSNIDVNSENQEPSPAEDDNDEIDPIAPPPHIDISRSRSRSRSRYADA